MKKAITHPTVAVALLSASLAAEAASAVITRFPDRHPEGTLIEYWRLTHDPAIRDHANYHNQDCWSPDGRYVCYTHHSSFYKGSADSYDPAYRSGLEPPGVHIIDLHKREKVAMGPGGTPRWAKQHNWLFFSRRDPRPNGPLDQPIQVCRYDCETGETDVITTGMKHLGSVDRQDRWIFGHRNQHVADDKPWSPLARALIQPGSTLEVIYQDSPAGGRPLCNPGHDMLTVRSNRHRLRSLLGFEPIRIWMDLDGSNVRSGVPNVQPCHMSWSGDGQWQLMGNYQIRGRRWNEPFPSDVHLLANISVGDISPCGRSGRWICGDYEVADLRSGHGIHLPRPPSFLCFPAQVGDASNPYDADPKGSPDGTKVSFVSNCDLEREPFAQLTATVKDGISLPVTTTDGFPESGELCVLGEVIAYESKTPTSFEGIERQRHGTGKALLSMGAYVTSFASRLMNDEEKARATPPWTWLARAVEESGEPDSKLLYQRQTDVYVSVVRLPDPPHLRRTAAGATLIPGENHWETYGYRLERDGETTADKPLRPGQTVTLDRGGVCRAIAVEWSGLEGKPSLPVQFGSGTRLTVLRKKPDDFSWTARVWRVDGSDVDEQKARAAETAVCEVRHLYDGVIRREWFQRGVLTRAEDLNADGVATRCLTYRNGRLHVREYWRPGQRGPISREIFGTDGFKTDEIRWRYGGQEEEYSHWYYDRGCPIKLAHREGREIYEKRGDAWHVVKRDY